MATNPFTLDYNQFLKAMQPYAAANNGAYSWSSPEGQNGSVGLTLADGRTWTPSGANSGVVFKPAGTPIMVQNPDTYNVRENGAPEMIQQGVTQADSWDIGGDMSSLLGTTDTNAHKLINYTKQGNQLVPTTVADWQYQSPGASFVDNAGPALAAFGLLAGGASLLGAGGGSTAASTATGFGGVGTDAAVMGTGGGLMGAPVAAGTAAAAQVAPAVEAGLMAPSASGVAGIGSSTAPMGFGGQALTTGELAGVASGTAGLTGAEIASITGGVGSASGASMNLLDLLPAGVKDVATFAKDNAGLLGAIGGAVAGSQDQTQSTTQSKTPWAEAAPWMKANLATGQELQKWYQTNPFNDQQKSAYQNLFSGVDNFNQNMPAMTDFANRGMNTAYQRQRGGQVGSGGGYGGPVQPGGLLSTGGRGFTSPQMQSLGQIDWTKVNPFAKG